MCFSATVPSKVKEVLSHVLVKGYTSISTIDASEPPTLEKVPQFSIFIPQAQDIFRTLLSVLRFEIDATKGDSKIIVFGVTANLVALYADLFRGLIPLQVFELRMSSRLSFPFSSFERIASPGALDIAGTTFFPTPAQEETES